MKLVSIFILTLVMFSSLIGVKAVGEDSLLFTSDIDGDRDIYAIGVDGGEMTQLTNNATEDRDPAWSPDYRQIAYVSYLDDGDSAIFMMDSDGRNSRRLTPESGGIAPEAPTWSPDGQRIAYVASSGAGRQVQVINIDGNGSNQLIQSAGDSIDPAWSPDGRQIAYAVPLETDYSAIFVANVDGGGVPSQLSREEGGDSFSPAWSLDGTKIVYAVTGGIHGDAIMVREPNGGMTPLYTSDTFVDSPVWSPDGSMIAFAEGGTRNSIVKIMNADGTNVRQLSEIENGEYLSWAAPALIQSSSGMSGSQSGIAAVPVTSGVISTPRLNVRSQPNRDSYVVARISLNDTVGVVGRNSSNTWVMIDTFGRVGWVNADYITVAGGVGSLPTLNDNMPLPAASSLFSFTCPGARGPNFALNSRFRVSSGLGSVAVREMPSSAVVLQRVPEGNGGTIIAGPICAAAAEDRRLVYWYVRTDTGVNGYMSEGYLSDAAAWIVPG